MLSWFVVVRLEIEGMAAVLYELVCASESALSPLSLSLCLLPLSGILSHPVLALFYGATALTAAYFQALDSGCICCSIKLVSTVTLCS